MKQKKYSRIKSIYTVSQKRMKFSQTYSLEIKKYGNKIKILNLKKFNEFISYKHFKWGP